MGQAAPSKQCGVMLVGPNGSGKGTQSAKLLDEFKFCHISTGDMLRDERAKGSELGKRAASFMDAGKLVPDELIRDMVTDKIASEPCKKGFILDGYPRNITQSQSLNGTLASKGSAISTVLNLEVSEELVVERCAGRWIHKPTGRVYHSKFHPPKVAQKDDLTGEPLMQRPDDKEAVVRKRFQTFQEQTRPILEYYKQNTKASMVNIDGSKPAADVWTEVHSAVKKAL